MPWKIWGEFCGPKFINFRFQNLPKTKKVSFLKDGQLKNLLKVIITLKLSVVTNSRHFPLLNLHSFALSITITKETKAKIKLTQNTASQLTRHSTYAWLNFTCYPACVASVSVRFRSKERGMRIKDRARNGVSKRAGRAGTFSFWLLFHFSRGQNRDPVPRSFFAPKPNGNACYAG